MLLGVSIIFSTCDPGHSLIVSNISKTNHRILVIYPLKKYWLRDSIYISRNKFYLGKKDFYYYSITQKDTSARSYSFLLPPGLDAMLEGGIGSTKPIQNQKIIIDNIDTILVINKTKRIKRHIWGNVYKLTLND